MFKDDTMEAILYRRTPSGCCATIFVDDENIDIHQCLSPGADVNCCLRAAGKLRLLAHRFEQIAELRNNIYDSKEQNKINRRNIVPECLWKYLPEESAWESSCGDMWTFSGHYGPKDNHMLFCPFCGKGLAEDTPTYISETDA